MADGQIELGHNVQSQEAHVDVDAVKATDKILAAFDSMDATGEDLHSFSGSPNPLSPTQSPRLTCGKRDEKGSSKAEAPPKPSAADSTTGWEERIAADSGWL